MILTVTPNPSLDLLYEADGLRWDDANRLAEPRRRPGGQGLNAARAVVAMGGRATAVALLGGATGDEIESVLEAEGVPLVRVTVTDPTRLFIGIRDRQARRSLLLNSRGPERTRADADSALDRIREAIAADSPAWVACCGSLPPGFPPDFYARVGPIAREAGARFVPDCDGEPLRLAAPDADLLVPNHHEAQRLIGRTAGDIETAAAAARAIHHELRVHLVAITLGARGAVLHDGQTTWAASPPPIEGSTVGAGDAFLAGLLIALQAGRPHDHALRTATAAGAAAVAATGSAIIDTTRQAHLEPDVRVRPIPP